MTSSTVHDVAIDVGIEIVDYDQIMLNELESMEPYDRHMAAYLSLRIEEKVIQKIKENKYKCSGCADVLLGANDRMNDELLAKKTTALEPAKQPLFSTLRIVVYSNAVLKEISSRSGQGNDIKDVLMTIFNGLDLDDLYPTGSFEQHENQQQQTKYTHKEQFIIQVVKMYLTLKSQNIGSKMTDKGQGTPIRHLNKDAIHKAGQ